MPEVWLHANRRPYYLPIAVCTIAALLCAWQRASLNVLNRPSNQWLIASVILATVGVGLWLISLRPRLSFNGSELLLYVRAGSPIAVPIELVEAFLIGKGPTYLSGRDDYKTEATTLIIRIAERAAEFEKLETNVRLAAWCGHYVTLRGTWTEPLSVDLINRLNQRLYEVQQRLKSERTEPARQAT